MLKRLPGFAVAVFLLVSTGMGAPVESSPLSGLTLSGQFGVFVMRGIGTATPGSWDTTTKPMRIDFTDNLYGGMVRQEPTERLGLGWDSPSGAVFGLGLGYRFTDRLLVSIDAEWSNKRDYGNEYDSDVVYSPEPNYGWGYEYIDESLWRQASMAVSFDYVPFSKHPYVYLTVGLIYTRFNYKVELVEEQYDEYFWSNTRRKYDEVGGALGYTAGGGYLFAQKPGSREAFVEMTWTAMPYGTALGLSEGARFFAREVEIDLGGFRLTTGIRFFVAQIF